MLFEMSAEPVGNPEHFRTRGPEELQKAIITIRDRAILTIRDVRKNMLRRTIAAKNMQESVGDDLLRQR